MLEGDRAVNLTCTADGEPVPNITWTKVFANGTDSHVLSTGGQFLLPNSRTNDGTYRCKASNGIGSDVNHTIIVVVNCEYCFLIVIPVYTVHLSPKSCFSMSMILFSS